MAYRYKNHEVSRLEALSDAVFGFSATLLVVSLEVPEDFSVLLEKLNDFGAFGISFFALIMIWSVHNAFFRRYGMDDKMTVILNSCLLFVVLFYVYPLKFLSLSITGSVLVTNNVNTNLDNWNQLSTLFTLYSVGFTALFSLFSCMYRNAYQKSSHLGLSKNQKDEALFYHRHYLIIALVGFISVILSWTTIGISIGLPGWIYFMIGPLVWCNISYSKKKNPALNI
jgi:uncharacterized membrane protein